MLPQDGKENSLQTVTENLGLESSQKESLHTRFRNNVFDNLQVGQGIWMALFVDLDNADGIGTRVTNGRRTESNQSATAQFLDAIVLLWDAYRQVVVGEEPRVVTDKGGRCSSDGSVVDAGEDVCNIIMCGNNRNG